MKRVKIDPPDYRNLDSSFTEQKRWNVLLGNGKRYSFSNKKDLAYCLAETNRQLNTVVFELNELWIQSFAEYRRNWFYMAPKTYLSEEAQVVNHNIEIAKYFNLLVERSSWVNGSTSAFRWIYLITECLKEQFKIYVRIRREKKQFIESRTLELKIRLIERIITDLENIDVSPKYGDVREKESSFTISNPPTPLR